MSVESNIAAAAAYLLTSEFAGRLAAARLKSRDAQAAGVDLPSIEVAKILNLRPDVTDLLMTFLASWERSETVLALMFSANEREPEAKH